MQHNAVSRAGPGKLRAILIVMLLTTGLLTVSAAPASAVGGCPYGVNYFSTWEDWLGGARVHAYVQFQGNQRCPDGRYVRRAYVRIIRQCGPYLDTGRIYTSSASSRYDSTRRSVHVWIFDSLLWSCQTNTYYGFEYF
jgi:hypothetical protein